MLSLRKLNSFVKVAQLGSFSHAAEALYLTQAAVSQQVQELEAQLGTSLFHRKPNSISLTEAGEILLQYALQILALAEQAEVAVGDVAKMQEELFIGATRPAAFYLAQTWVSTFHKQYPQMKTVLQTTSNADLLFKKILSGELDVAFVEGKMTFHSPKIQMAELQNAKLCVVFGANHPWRERKSVSIYEVAQQPLVACSRQSQLHIWLEELFASFKLPCQVVSEFDDPHTILMSVANGVGISVLPSCAFSNDSTLGQDAIHCARIQEVQEIRFPIHVLWSSGKSFPPAARAFMTFLSKDFPDILHLLTI